jgi:signal transduction histidine kinase
MTPDQVSTYLADIHDCGAYLLDLINDLLDLSKAEAGKLDLDEDQVPLSDVVEDCLKITAGLPFAKGLEFQVEVAPPRAVLLADRRRIKQMLLNLLSNAAKFTPGGGRVSVTSGIDDGGDLILRVRDTGIGIAADDLEEITKPFVQVSGPGSGRHQGTGLGLHMVRTLIELHGGTMEIESEADAGTSVSLRFPAARLG